MNQTKVFMTYWLPCVSVVCSGISITVRNCFRNRVSGRDLCICWIDEPSEPNYKNNVNKKIDLK